MNTELKFGKLAIAKNFNTYRMAVATPAFWEEWNGNKEAMKAEGVSPFKHNGKFYVAKYDGGKVTEEEYKAQEDSNFARWRQSFISELNSDNLDNDQDDVLDEVFDTKTIYEAFDLASTVFPAGLVAHACEYAHERVFTNYLGQ